MVAPARLNFGVGLKLLMKGPHGVKQWAYLKAIGHQEFKVIQDIMDASNSLLEQRSVGLWPPDPPVSSIVSFSAAWAFAPLTESIIRCRPRLPLVAENSMV